jgi:hypothetical protein
MKACPHCGGSLEGGPQQNLELTAGHPGVAFDYLPLANGREYPVYTKMIAVYKQAYPGVDIAAELPKMRAWFMSNPTKRKTDRGMARFINNWLSKAQDNPRNSNNGNSRTIADEQRAQSNRVFAQRRGN